MKRYLNKRKRKIEVGSVVFVSGVYGVGKSTLCNNLAQKCHIKFYSAGDIISEENGEKYGSNKLVKNKELNQDILIKKISKKLEHEKIILLAGHFAFWVITDRWNNFRRMYIVSYNFPQLYY